MMRLKVAILGAGAMGTLYGYALAQHNDVTMVDVRQDVVEDIAASGLVVDDGPPRRVTATQDPARAFGCAFLFVFVKAGDTLAAVRPFARQLNPSTPIVSLQNGLGNEEAIKAALGERVALVVGITTEGALAVGRGQARRLGIGSTVLGSAGASGATLQSVARLLEDAGLSTSIAYDIRPHLWGKLLVNAAISPVAALLDRRNEAIVNDADAAELARAIAAEVAAVARALRIHLPTADPWEYVRETVAAMAEQRNSMTIDLEARRPTEIEQINGGIAAAGRRAGVPTPYNDAVLRLIRAKQRSR
ncbi:MAG: 2-dehydropantoate 2-reductase [Candidatus Eremiobacteraeota bacterium]|nr:2-dehydropantoate 2-reductase [Candidatus Eremiobacteraeota bacterium]